MTDTKKGKIVIVGNRCLNNQQIRSSVSKLSLNYEIVSSSTGSEYAEGSKSELVFVYDSFDDEVFMFLDTHNCNVIGPQILHAAASQQTPLPYGRRRSLYNNSMKDVVICFTGFNDRKQISELASLVHYMNGTIKKEYSPKVTHLVAYHTKGEKYKKAVSFGIPIMMQDWIYHLWNKRDELSVSANSPSMLEYRAPPFLRCFITFVGFTEADIKDMEEIALSNGGQLCPLNDSACTHLVVDDVNSLPHDVHPYVMVVKPEWFWASVQMRVCADERIYAVETESKENCLMVTDMNKTRGSSRSKKRKICLRENLAALASEGEAVHAGYMAYNLSSDHLSTSYLSDVTPDTSVCFVDTPGAPSSKKPSSPSPEKNQGKPSAKRLIVSELLQTEINYCGILSIILTIFRDGSEKEDQPGGPILSSTDSRAIFGKIPPIYELHKEIKTDLEHLLRKWTDSASIADIILNKVDKFRQVYPPFINYMEKTKETIASCVKNNHRFHAFMKVCERKPECGRQSLPDLLMSIVQRLPRIELLLQQIHKYTDKKSAEYRSLEIVQSALKEVMTFINEDKRITNERMVLFEIMNEIDNCPPYLLSASRSLMQSYDVCEVSNELAGRGYHLTLFVFSDSIEIVKRRNKSLSTPFKSPASNKGSSQSLVSNRSKPYKHIDFMPLQSIKRVIDIQISEDGPDCPLFSLLCRKVTDAREKLYTFQLSPDSKTDKQEIIQTLAKNIANCLCRTDYETLITSGLADHFMISPLDESSTNKSMTRAVSKFGKRLSRAMTIKGVPSPLKRAVSSVMTPTRRFSIRNHDPSLTVSSANLSSVEQYEGSPNASAPSYHTLSKLTSVSGLTGT